MLDSHALLVFLFKEAGHERVLALLEGSVERGRRLFIAAPNWAEVRYIVSRRAGEARWTLVRERLLGLPMEIVPADQTLAEEAGRLKASRAMSLADCFAAALAMRHDADLLTGDPEFRAVAKEARIVWLD